MEFEGRITRILPARTGTRNDGSPWTELSFVFAYYENSEQHYEDSTIVSTFDTPIMAALAPYVAKDEKGKVIIENDCAKMLISYIPCRCGFTLKTKVVAKKDGSGYIVIQNNRCYKLEVTQQQPAQQPQGALGQALAPQSQVVYQPQQQVPFPPQNQEGGADDLPF